MKVEVILKKGKPHVRDQKLKYSVYCLYCPVSKEIKYIGFTSQDLRQRMTTHIYEGFTMKTKKAKWIKSIIKKGYPLYGRILRTYDTRSEAWGMENYLIESISEKRVLYNTDSQGRGFGLAKKR
jgi:predicted GIY-YIG superfamily endonuclease